LIKFFGCFLIEKMDHNVGSSHDENSDVRPLKKTKMSEEKLSDEKTMASPTRETLSSDSELIDKQVREEKFPLHDEQQLKEQNNVVDTYDYLPQGIFFIYIYSLSIIVARI